jgi:hypothetical protein
MSLRFFFSCLVLGLALTLPVHSRNPEPAEEQTPRRPQMNLNATPQEQAAFDEAAASDDGGSVTRPISAYRRFIKNNPASPLAAKAQFRIAELYESTGNASKAFDAYQTLVKWSSPTNTSPEKNSPFCGCPSFPGPTAPRRCSPPSLKMPLSAKTPRSLSSIWVSPTSAKAN